MVGRLIAQVIAAGIIVTAYGVYWIGLEAVQGTVVANAVRLASTGTTYSHCNQWLADGTASLIQRKPGVAEATDGGSSTKYEKPCRGISFWIAASRMDFCTVGLPMMCRGKEEQSTSLGTEKAP
jgi:hypothetical protein